MQTLTQKEVAKQLGINQSIYDNEQQEIKDLIETNIRQRGDISSSSLKMGRIIKTLEECYGIKQGGDRKSNPPMVDLKSQRDIAEQLGTNEFPKYKFDIGSNKLFKLLDISKEDREDFISKPHEINGQTKTGDLISPVLVYSVVTYMCHIFGTTYLHHLQILLNHLYYN